MPDVDCKKCGGVGWHDELKWTDHGRLNEEVRCKCNPPQWLSVLDIALTRTEFWQTYHDGAAMDQVDSILDGLMLDLDRETEAKLISLLTK